MRIKEGSGPAATTFFRRRSSHSERIRSLFASRRSAALEPLRGTLSLPAATPAWPFVIGSVQPYACAYQLASGHDLPVRARSPAYSTWKVEIGQQTTPAAAPFIRVPNATTKP